MPTEWISDPAVGVGLATLVALEIVLPEGRHHTAAGLSSVPRRSVFATYRDLVRRFSAAPYRRER